MRGARTVVQDPSTSISTAGCVVQDFVTCPPPCSPPSLTPSLTGGTLLAASWDISQCRPTCICPQVQTFAGTTTKVEGRWEACAGCRWGQLHFTTGQEGHHTAHPSPTPAVPRAPCSLQLASSVVYCCVPCCDAGCGLPVFLVCRSLEGTNPVGYGAELRTNALRFVRASHTAASSSLVTHAVIRCINSVHTHCA